MNVKPIVLIPLVIALGLLAACSGSDSGTGPTASPSGDGTAPPDEPTEEPSAEPVTTRKTTFIADNVTLWNSEESDLGFRVLFESPASQVRVRLRGVPANNRVVSVCPVRGLTQTSPGSTCSYPANTEQIEVRHASRFNGVEVLLLGTAPNGGERLTLGQIRVIYEGLATGGETTVKTPPILRPRTGRPCRDNACNPTFQVSPANTGRLRASTSFEGSGRAELAVESGGDTVDSKEGPRDLRVSGRITATGDPLIALRNTGSRTLAVAITRITWP